MRRNFKRSYKPFRGLSDSVKLCGNPGGYVQTHRAHAFVPAQVTPELVVRALRKMLLNQPLEEWEEEQKIAPMLKEFLDKAYPDQHAGTDKRPSSKWGIASKKAYLGVKYNGADLPIGKVTPRSRFVSQECYLHMALMSDKEGPQHWLWLGASPTKQAVANLLAPPWKGFNVGTVDFYILLSDTRPQDVLNIKKALLTPAKIAARTEAEEARKAAETAWRIAAMPGKNPKGRQKRRLSNEESEKLKTVRARAYEDAYLAYMDKPEVKKAKLSLQIDYPLKLGVWPADHPAMANVAPSGAKRFAEQMRSRELSLARIFKKAQKNHASVVAAEPGGKDARAAATSFASAAASCSL